MLALTLALVVSQTPSLPPLPEPDVPPATGRASLIQSEIAEIDRSIEGITRKPVWVPLLVGLGGVGLSVGLIALAVAFPINIAVLLITVGVGIVGAISAFILGIVFIDRASVFNAEGDIRRLALQKKRAALEAELSRTQASQMPWHPHALATVFCF